MGRRKYSDDVINALRDPRIAWASSQIGIKNFDSSNDVRAARDYLNRVGGTPWERQIQQANQRTNDLINQMNVQRDRDAWRMRNLQAQNQANIDRITTRKNNEIQTIYARNQEEVRRLNSQFDQRYQQQQQAFDRRYGVLDTQYKNLGNRFEDLTGAFNDLGDQYKAQGAQLEETTGLYREQTRLANNKARASVPAPVQSAVSPVSGDSRQAEALGRRRRDNTLSSLTILSGLGAAGAGAPGLQIA